MILESDRVLYDMDKPLADWCAGFIAGWARLKPHLPKLRLMDRIHFNVEDCFEELCGERFEQDVLEIIHEPGFFLNLPVVPGAQWALAETERLGIPFAVCSRPMLDHPTCITEKQEWLERHFGSKVSQGAVFTQDKTEVPGRILLDDSPVIIGKAVPQWEHILFDAPYNRRIINKPRANWSTWIPLVQKLFCP